MFNINVVTKSSTKPASYQARAWDLKTIKGWLIIQLIDKGNVFFNLHDVSSFSIEEVEVVDE